MGVYAAGSQLLTGNRLAGEDVHLGLRALPKSTYVCTSIGVANRDPEVFDALNHFDIERKQNDHIAFVAGKHVRLGATLAWIGGQIAISCFVLRFPKLAQVWPWVHLPLARFRRYAGFSISVA